MKYIKDNRTYPNVKTITFKFSEAYIEQLGYDNYKVTTSIDESISEYFTDQDYILDTNFSVSDNYIYVQIWYKHYEVRNTNR